MGHVVRNMVKMVGLSKTPRVDVSLRQGLEQLTDLAEKSPNLTVRERLHVKAVQQFADGYHMCYFISFIRVPFAVSKGWLSY